MSQRTQSSVNPVALSSYSVAICSFSIAALGMGFSHWPSGALAGVGGFYLIVGFFSRTSPLIANSHGAEHADVSRQTSGAENLIAEAVGVGSGLGQIIMMARNTFNASLVFFTMTLIGLLGFSFDRGLLWVQQRVLWWVGPSAVQGK